MPKFVLLAAVALALVGAGCTPAPTTPTTEAPKPAPSPAVTVDVPAPLDSSFVPWQGELLGGDPRHAPVLDFTEADYRRALAERTRVLLYFYADWCPVCRKEFPVLVEAVNDVAAARDANTEQLAVFRVNFNDGATDDVERQLAREFGVAYQHTKVVLRGGARVAKSPESWAAERYASELEALLK